MDNFNKSNLYYEDEWQSTSIPIVKTVEDDHAHIQTEDDVKSPHQKKKHSKHPVLTFQLTVTLVALILVFGLKFLSKPLYEIVINWYQQEISESVIYNGDFESFDFSLIFATNDEA